MNAQEIVAALDLPAGARVDQRVPKKLLVEHGAPTTGDRRRLNEGVEIVQWLAALKPTTAGVPSFRDEAREYLEIAVLYAELRVHAKASRVTELIHRAVPYPVVLISVHGSKLAFSLAHKRWSLGEGGSTLVDGDVVRLEWDSLGEDTYRAAFLDALAVGRQPRSSLFALYQGWMDTLLVLRTARLTGIWKPATDAADAAARQSALNEYMRLKKDISYLRARARNERQIQRRVDLNLQAKKLENEIPSLLNKL